MHERNAVQVIATNEWGHEGATAMRELTQEERDILFILGSAARGEAALDQVHPSDTDEFRRHIHACQNIILARPAQDIRGGTVDKEGDGHGAVSAVR